MILEILDFINPKNNVDFKELFVNAISFVNSPELQSRIFFLKIAFLSASGLFAGMILFILLRTHYLKWLFLEDLVQFFTQRPYGAKKITRTWNAILRRLELGSEPEYKLAVIEADNMLEASLRRLGYTGANLEERLQKLTSVNLSNISQVREAHQTRNNIVHDPDYRLSLDEAKTTIDVYGQAFRDLQILE